MSKSMKKRIEAQKDQSKEIVIVVDRSGSMSGQEVEVEGGLQSFIDDQIKMNPKAKITLAEFDDNYDLLYSSVGLKKVEYKHSPRGMTALLDAVGKTATDAHTRFKKKKTYPDVLMVIITDGHENASQEFKRESLKTLMDKLKNKYDWDDLFIGAKFDDFSDAHSIGTMHIATASAQSMRTAFTNTSAYYVGTRNVGMDRNMAKAQWKQDTEDDTETDTGA